MGFSHCPASLVALPNCIAWEGGGHYLAFALPGPGAQGDALIIESQAKQRLTDEYDAAQVRGEIGQSGARTDLVPSGNEVVPTAEDLGLTRKQVYEARQVRDAELEDPGIVQRTVDEFVEAGQEPTKAAVREAIACPGRDSRLVAQRRTARSDARSALPDMEGLPRTVGKLASRAESYCRRRE